MAVRELAAQLRELSGFEEEWISRRAQATRNVPAACHEILARCLGEPGERPSAHRDAIAALSLAERDWLLVELRRRSLGARIQSEVQCPACGEGMQFDLAIGDLPFAPAEPPAPVDVPLPGGRSAVLRPLTADDHERFAAAAGLDATEQLLLALSHTLVSADVEPANLTPDDRAALARALESLGPEPLTLDLACHECGQALAVPFDICAFFLAEVRAHSRTLLDDVHTLARTYHWSEREILGLPLGRRLAYLVRIEQDADAALLPGEETVW